MLWSFQRNILSKVWGNLIAFESGPERGGPVSVSDDVMASQNYTKVKQVKTWLLSLSRAKNPTVLNWNNFFAAINYKKINTTSKKTRNELFSSTNVLNLENSTYS